MNGIQKELFEPYEELRFNGADYVPERDNPRLGRQLSLIFNLMKDASWRTLSEIANKTGEPEASISAQLRHLRKERFGSHTVNRRHEEGKALYEYQLIVNEKV